MLNKNICILYRNVLYIYTLQVHMSTSGIVIHYIGPDSQSPNPNKYNVLKENFVLVKNVIFLYLPLQGTL